MTIDRTSVAPRPTGQQVWLMDEINIGPRHDLRLPSRRWLVVVAAHSARSS
jgi:hypothetical protein